MREADATLQRHHTALRERVAEAAERLDVPGVAVGITLGGAEDYVFHGVTSLPNPLPVDAATFFPIGSTDKTIVATALMLLVERGLVDLAAPVRRYIPELRLQDEDVAQRVTVLHLLNHTSGWAGDFSPDTGHGDDAHARFIERLVEAEQEEPLGERVSYSDSGFSVAQRVIEKVTGTRYETALRDLVFEPLGLREHLCFAWEVMTRRFAAGHSRVGDALEVTPWDEGICATARDQIRYAHFHLGDVAGVLHPETLCRMQTRTTPQTDTRQAQVFGISWMLREIDGVRIVAHGGSNRGHQSAFEMVPERRFAFVALTNARHGLELLTELKEWAFTTYLGLTEPQAELLALSAEDLSSYAGEYVSHTGVLTVTVEGELLVGRLAFNPEMLAEAGEAEDTPDEPPLPFRILPDNQFLIVEGQYKGLHGAILRGSDGRISGLDLGRVFVRRE